MSRFKVNSTVDGGDKTGNAYDNRAIEIDRNDPVQLSAYGLYTKRDSLTTSPHTADNSATAVANNAGPTQRKSSTAGRDAPRKISLGIAQWTR